MWLYSKIISLLHKLKSQGKWSVYFYFQTTLWFVIVALVSSVKRTNLAVHWTNLFQLAFTGFITTLVLMSEKLPFNSELWWRLWGVLISVGVQHGHAEQRVCDFLWSHEHGKRSRGQTTRTLPWETFSSRRRSETSGSSSTTQQCCPVCFYNCTRRTRHPEENL